VVYLLGAVTEQAPCRNALPPAHAAERQKIHLARLHSRLGGGWRRGYQAGHEELRCACAILSKDLVIKDAVVTDVSPLMPGVAVVQGMTVVAQIEVPSAALRIVTASSDNTARLLRIFPGTQEIVAVAKAASPRCLTAEQRHQFFLPAEPPTWCAGEILTTRLPGNNGSAIHCPVSARRCHLRREKVRCAGEIVSERGSLGNDCRRTA
jgi:hypothetical protein